MKKYMFLLMLILAIAVLAKFVEDKPDCLLFVELGIKVRLCTLDD